MPIKMTTTRVWLIGLAGAFVGGGFAVLMDGASLAMLDPTGPLAPFTKLWYAKMVFTLISSGGASAKLYLASHPFEQVLSELTLEATDRAGNVTTTKLTRETTTNVPPVAPDAP